MTGTDALFIVGLFLTTAVPLMLGAAAFLMRARGPRSAVVWAAALSAVAGSLMIFYVLWDADGHVAARNLHVLNLGGMEIDLFEAIAIADVALMVWFLYITAAARSWLGMALTLAQLVPLAWYEFVYGPEADPGTQTIYADYWSGIMCLIISVIGSLIVLYALKYMDGERNQPRFFAFMVAFLGAMNAAVFSNELLWFFFFWEITTLASYMLIKHDETPEALANAKWAVELNLAGGAAMAAAIVVLGVKYHITTFSELIAAGELAALAVVALALVCFAGLVKSAQVPFQSWLLGAMVAPTPVSALLHSSTMVKLGVYLVIRVSPTFASIPELGYVLAAIGAFSFAATSVLAFAQNNAKKVLAYSTIGNLGLIIMLAGINTPLAISAAIIITVFHAISKAMLFLGVGVVQHDTRSREIENMEGLLLKKPFIAMVIFAGIMTMLVPPFGVFIGKYLAVESALDMPFLVFMLAIGVGATAAYYVKWLGRIITADDDARAPREKMHLLFAGPLTIMLALAVVLSVAIAPLTDHFINPAVAGLGYNVALTTSAFGIGSAEGYISTLAVGAMMALVLAVPYMLSMDRRRATTAYNAGTDFKFALRGAYLDDYVGEGRLNSVVNSVGAALMADLLVLGALVYLMPGVF